MTRSLTVGGLSSATTVHSPGLARGHTVTQRGKGRSGACALLLALTVVADGGFVAAAQASPTGTAALHLGLGATGAGDAISPVTGTGSPLLRLSAASAGAAISPVTGAGAEALALGMVATGAVGPVTGAGAMTSPPLLGAGAGLYTAPVAGSGSAALGLVVAGVGSMLGLVAGDGAETLTLAMSGAGSVSGASGTLVFTESFASLSLRTRGRSGTEGPFEQSWLEGSGIWTPRHQFFSSLDTATYNDQEWAAFLDASSPAVIASGYSPFSVAGGELTIRAEPKPAAIAAAGIVLPDRRFPGSTDTGVELPWTSGLATTRHSAWFGAPWRVTFEYWLTKGQASFPAPIWFLTREGYQANELDAAEFQGHKPTFLNWAVHGVSSDGLWADRGQGDLSGQWISGEARLEDGVFRTYLNGALMGQSIALDRSYFEAHWYLITNNAIANWEDWSGPDTSATPYPTQIPSDMKLRNINVYVGDGGDWGGEATPAILGDISWVAGALAGTAPSLHIDFVNGRCWEAGMLRHPGHVTSVVGGRREGYGALFKALCAQSGTLVCHVDTPPGANAGSIGALLSPSFEWAWMIMGPGTALSIKHAGGSLPLPGFGAGAKTIVRSWDPSLTKGLVGGSSVVSAPYPNLSYLGERMGVGVSGFGDNPYAGTVKDVIFYPHTSALSDADMGAVA